MDEVTIPQSSVINQPTAFSMIDDIERQSSIVSQLSHDRRLMAVQLDDWRCRLATAEDQAKRVRRLKAELANVVDKLGTERVELEKRVAGLEADLKERLDRSCLMADESQDADRLDRERLTLQDEVKTAKIVLKKIKEEKESIIVKLSDQARSAKMALDDRAASLQSARQMSKMEADKLVSQTTAMLSSIAEVEAKVSQSSAILESIKAKNSSLVEAVRDLNDRLEHLRESQASSKQQAFRERKLKTQDTKRLEQLMMDLAERKEQCIAERSALEAELAQLS